MSEKKLKQLYKLLVEYEADLRKVPSIRDAKEYGTPDVSQPLAADFVHVLTVQVRKEME